MLLPCDIAASALKPDIKGAALFSSSFSASVLRASYGLRRRFGLRRRRFLRFLFFSFDSWR